MEATMEQTCKKDSKEDEYATRSQSQEPLDSSSASSLSVFADHSDTQNSIARTPDHLTDSQKSEDYTERTTMDEALKSEKAFIEYVMSFPPKETSEHHRSIDSMSTKSKSPTTISATTKVGLDHLDNLCKLMEQLSDLRDTNCKLHKRVQYLEDLKTLHDMHKEITEGNQYSSKEVITAKSGPYELQKSATETHVRMKDKEPTISNRSPSKYLSRRSRSQQVGSPRRERSKSVGHEDLGEDTKSKRLFPKWSKVKEAFGWESERKDSAKSKEERCSVQQPRRRSDESRQTLRHPGSPTWYQDSASLHSSLEDVNEEFEDGRWKRSSLASDKYVVTLDIPSDRLKRQKSTPSPGSDKVHAYRDHTDLKVKSSTIERDSCRAHELSKFDKEDGKRGKGPWGRVKTIIEKRRDSLKRRSLRRDFSTGDFESAMSKNALHYVEATDMKNCSDFVESSLKYVVTEDAVMKKRNKPGPIVFDPDVEYNCPRTPSSSPTFHRKSTWTKVKKALKGKRDDERDPLSLSTPVSPDSPHDGNFTFDVIDDIPKDDEHDGREMTRIGSEDYVHQLSSMSPSSDLMLQLQSNLSDDFNKKIREWERMRASGNVSCSPQWDRKPSDPTRSRKKSERDDSSKNIKPKIKDLAWLEKELQKIEKEKQRLAKERQKYEERALRLEKLRDTVLTANNSNKREVLVKTSAGEFRFEGISDAFTKKLYEWETKRGLGPELSTIALLDSSRLIAQPAMTQKNGQLQRVLSRSESSIADIGQPSHNSSNSLPSVKLSEALENDRQNHSSRANSEPDLSTLVALKNGTNISVTTLKQCIDESLENEAATTTAGKDSDEAEFDKKRKDSETYYSLLEENVILLEQLKDKEEICRRLEKELEILDEKVDVMNAHHIQETERYRAKLWEMHRQGATPSDVICCRQTMEQLKMRIDALERCTEKLRNDRETVEDSFRYHSKEQETMTLDLLEKMRELKAAGASKSEMDTRPMTFMETSTIERLQDLSALLMKQTRELEATLSEKTRQICQLKWELLHKDLSTVKLQTELHTHTVHRKRSKYAHWRSRSSEEPTASTNVQELDSGDSLTLVTDMYNCGTPSNEFKAKHLANTVQQLNNEVMKLTTTTDCLQGQDLFETAAATAKVPEGVSRNRKSYQPSSKDEFKKITVRRSSADNLNHLINNDNRDGNSSTQSDNSSDEYYTRVSWRSGVKSSFPINSDTERLLMSYGEHPPRSYPQRKKKLQKTSKSSSNSCRRRSNTFHTNRDLEKPNINETGPQKCQSFRIARKHEEGARDKNSDMSLLKNINFHKNNIGLKTLEHMLIREVASDSKISLLQFQNRIQADDFKSNPSHCPTRSMSDKHKSDAAALKRENIQKKRFKKRLKSPDSPTSLNKTTDVAHNRNVVRTNSRCNSLHGNSNKNDFSNSQSDIQTKLAEIPTITIQFPKRKLKKTSYSVDDGTINEEQSFTIVMPKKRSLSSEHESSSVSESSPRLPHSTEESNSSDTLLQNNSTVRSLTDPYLVPHTNSAAAGNTSGNIQLLKLVSLNKFDSPFEQHDSKTRTQIEEFSKKKRKADKCVITDAESSNYTHSNTGKQIIQPDSPKIRNPFDHATFTSHYVKSPSAPQLDWRKVCAKKVSKAGAPNVKTLIEKYNQKVMESQTYTSPYSSNVSSPVTNRKISEPLQPSFSYVSQVTPQFCSTPNTPTITESSNSPLSFRTANSEFSSKSPPSSPLSIARAETLRKAKENFISSQTSLSFSATFKVDNLNRSVSDDTSENPITDNFKRERLSADAGKQELLQRTRLDEDGVSSSSMDSMSIVMLRAGENCQESRMPKRNLDVRRTDAQGEQHNLKTSKSLSNSSLFKSVLHSDFKLPSSLLRLKKSKRKKDMGAVTQLCRQSLFLTDENSDMIPGKVSHKSCPSSPELKSKSITKPSWFQRNILKHK